MSIKCDICKKIFRSKYILDKHINKKQSCLHVKENDINLKLNRLNKYIITRDKSIDNQQKKCLYCQHIFSTKGNLKNHIYSHCEIRKKKIENLEKIKNELNQIKNNLNQNNQNNENVNIDNNDENNNVLDEDSESEIDETLDNKTLRKMLHKLTKEVEKLSSKQSSITPQTIQTQNNVNNQQIIENQNNNNNNYTNNIQINQINLNNYDNPNCDFLTIEQKNKFLKDRYKGLIDFITFVYFNESYPENHTILYTNLRSKFGHIYKNNKWMIEEIDMIADKLNDYSFDKLSEHLDTIKDNKYDTTKYEKDIEKGEKFIEHYTSNDTTKQARTNIKKIIYNNKDLITKTKICNENNKKLTQ
jgi:hypothetical protein